MSDGFTLKTRPILDRFWIKVSMAEADQCWEWSGRRKKQVINGKTYDYGIFALPVVAGKRTEVRAHRFAWETWHRKPVPAGMVLRHGCDNPPCVNPAHLEPGTSADNMRDMVERGRHYMAGRTRCPNGHDLSLPGMKGPRGCTGCARERQRRYEARVASK